MRHVNFGDHHVAANHLTAAEYLALEPGDIVVCRDSSGSVFLKEGALYVVHDTKDQRDAFGELVAHIHVQEADSGKNRGYRYAGRFAMPGATIATAPTQVDSTAPVGSRVRMLRNSYVYPKIKKGMIGTVSEQPPAATGLFIQFDCNTQPVGVPYNAVERVTDGDHTDALLRAFEG